MTDREDLRTTFNQDAELYDRARPGYPEQLFDDLTTLVGVGPGCRLLEIGCGTGQATVSLAERGCRIAALDLGPDMAAVARRKLVPYRSSVEVVTAAFEDWPLPAEPFDVVFSATAFHWVDPAVRVGRSADALRPGGSLTTVATHHIDGGTRRFFAEAQNCYERFDPATPPGVRLQPAADIASDDAEIVVSDRFGPALFRRYEWDQTYTTAEYRDLLMTYSPTRSLPVAARTALLDCITGLIDRRYGGRITKRYLSELRVAERVS